MSGWSEGVDRGLDMRPTRMHNSETPRCESIFLRWTFRIRSKSLPIRPESAEDFLGDLISSIHSDYFYSTSSSPLIFRSDPDTARILRQSVAPKRHRQLRVKDLSKVPTWRLERAFGRKAWNLAMNHHAPRTTGAALAFESSLDWWIDIDVRG